MHKPLWIIGCGDIGRRVAKLYPNKAVNGVILSKASLLLCKKNKINAIQADFDNDVLSLSLENHGSLDHFDNVDIFYFMPPPTNEREDTRIIKFLNVIEARPNRIVLISTTGVYGDSKGEWIDETTPVNPMADRAHRRLSAESHLKDWSTKYKKSFMILRVPGIYALDRLPLARIKKGLPIVNESEAGFTNRIHADDLAQICKAAMDTTIKNEIINVTDGHPSTMTDYFNQIADFSNLSRPPQISMADAEATLSKGMVSYLKESRRIENKKMLSLLKVKLRYPELSVALSSNK